MANKPDWVVRLQRWPIGVVGQFLGTVTAKDPRGIAARYWIRRLLMTQAEQLALLSLLIDKGIVGKEEYELALQNAAHKLCYELELQYPGIVSRDDGVSIDVKQAYSYMKDWPQ